MNPVIKKTMSKHSSKYENIKAQLKLDEELLRSNLVKTSQRFAKKWYSRLLGISLVTAIIGLGYLLFRPQKKAAKKVKNKEKLSYRSRSLGGILYAFILNQMPLILEKIYKEITGTKKTKG